MRLIYLYIIILTFCYSVKAYSFNWPVLFFSSECILKDSIKKSNPDNFVLTSIPSSNPAEIKIKWYSSSFMYPEGVIIYRKETTATTWQKLNETPLKKGSYTPSAEELRGDPELKEYMSIVNSVKVLDGIPKLGAYVKSFKSDAFSKYIGIEFIDRTCDAGKSVHYKLCVINSGSEIELGISDPLISGKPTELLPPNDIDIIAKNKKATIKWLPETSRYYAVNIFRMFDSTGSDRIKVNKDPIIVSKNKNKEGVYAYPEQFYIDEKLKDDTTYYYSFKTIDFFGVESEFSHPIKVFIKDMDAPLPPLLIERKTQNRFVTLKWQKLNFEKDFTGFNIYRAQRSENTYTKANKTLIPKTDSTFTDSVMRYGLFRYVIASIDRSGNEGVTEEIPIETIDEIPPAVPKALVITSDTGRITLTWQQNTETDLWGYMVYQAINKHVRNEEYVLITPKPLKTNLFKQELAKNSKNKFLYKVLAMDSSYNKSELSDFAVTTLPDVVAPSDPFIHNSYVNSDKNIVIEFFRNTELDLKGYHLFRVYKEDGQEKTEQVNAKLIDKTAIRYIDRDYENYGPVNYYLVAVDSTDNMSKRSNPAKFNLKKEEETVTYEFKSFKAKRMKLAGNWRLKWKLENDEELFYVVYTREAGDDQFEPYTKNLNDTKTMVNLKNSSNFYVQVRAYNAKGLVAKSNSVLLENKTLKN